MIQKTKALIAIFLLLTTEFAHSQICIDFKSNWLLEVRLLSFDQTSRSASVELITSAPVRQIFEPVVQFSDNGTVIIGISISDECTTNPPFISERVITTIPNVHPGNLNFIVGGTFNAAGIGIPPSLPLQQFTLTIPNTSPQPHSHLSVFL